MKTNRNRLNIPRKISVMGWPVTIKLVTKKDLSEGDENVYGDWNEELNEIRLATDVTDAMMISTLYHEILHACLYYTGWSNILTDSAEEGLVMALEHAYLPTIKQVIQCDPGLPPKRKPK